MILNGWPERGIALAAALLFIAAGWGLARPNTPPRISRHPVSSADSADTGAPVRLQHVAAAAAASSGRRVIVHGRIVAVTAPGTVWVQNLRHQTVLVTLPAAGPGCGPAGPWSAGDPVRIQGQLRLTRGDVMAEQIKSVRGSISDGALLLRGVRIQASCRMVQGMASVALADR